MENFTLPQEFKDIPRLLKDLETKSENYWIKRGEKQALRLFHLMAQRVPAYKSFLKENKIVPEKIKTIQDFKSIPTIDKNNYLKKYPLEKLCWDGKFKNKQWVISATSGSTGDPFYFPREKFQDLQYATTAELYLRTNFDIHNKSTLYIDAFGMGVWIGGLFTYQAIKHVAENGNYKLSIITPGTNKSELLKAVKALGHKFDQIIIGAYGPFLKDALDDGEREGIKWRDYNLGFIFSAEGFTETFRDYVIKKAGLKNPYKDTLNHYGTVDLGTMSYETPIAILARRVAVRNKEIYSSLFGETVKLPTLTQYMPEMFFFEDLSGNLICSAFSGLPLVRYDLKDHGGVTTFKELNTIFSNENIDLRKEAKKGEIEDTIWSLPFVYVYERSDFAVSFYAANVYPETIKRALQNRTVEKSITGKFTMMTKSDSQENQYLEINVELKSGIKESKSLHRKATDLVTKQLLRESSEYRNTHDAIGERAIPNIVFWPYEDPRYFQPGTKQKWIEK